MLPFNEAFYRTAPLNRVAALRHRGRALLGQIDFFDNNRVVLKLIRFQKIFPLQPNRDPAQAVRSSPVYSGRSVSDGQKGLQ